MSEDENSRASSSTPSEELPPPANPLLSRPVACSVPRQGFTKSRRGCYNCKRRKVKCQETYPSCLNCWKTRVNCEYPAIRNPNPPLLSGERGGRLVLDTGPGEILQMQATPMIFNLTDLRLFHHFLFNAYPHLPLGNDQVWVRDIAAFAHSYKFLVHSVLGLAASHLSITSTSNLESVGLSHRVLAVQGLNEVLSKPPKTSADGDAILAACYALALQSSYIGNCVEESLVMSRGCQLIMAQNWSGKLGTVFHSLDPDCQIEVASKKLGCLPTIDSRRVKVARDSLKELEPLCSTSTETNLLHELLKVIYALEESSREAYFQHSRLSTAVSSLPESEFQLLIDTTNPVMQILLAYKVAVFVLIFPIKAREWNGRYIGTPIRTSMFRLDSIVSNVPMHMQKYLEWPLRTTSSLSVVSNLLPK